MGKVLRQKLGIRFPGFRISCSQPNLLEIIETLKLSLSIKKNYKKTCFAPWALPEGWVEEAIRPKHGRVGPFDQNMTTGIWTSLLFKRPNPILSHKLRKGAFREVVDSLRDILESQADHFGKALS